MAHFPKTLFYQTMIITKNRKAAFNYHIEQVFNAGIILTGSEVKSIRNNKVAIDAAYVVIENDEAFLVDCRIEQYVNCLNHDPVRKRKLLLTKSEIQKLKERTTDRGMTIVPLSVFLSGNLIKIEVALAKGKKLYDKRESIKLKEANKEIKCKR